jgi:hypothetical protein
VFQFLQPDSFNLFFFKFSGGIRTNLFDLRRTFKGNKFNDFFPVDVINNSIDGDAVKPGLYPGFSFKGRLFFQYFDKYVVEDFLGFRFIVKIKEAQFVKSLPVFINNFIDIHFCFVSIISFSFRRRR